MATELDVRRYEPADADRVWTVHERALRASPLEFVEGTSADEDLTGIVDRYLDAGGEFLVGVVDGDLVATGGFQPRGEDTVEIRRMRVHPEHQRRGFGEQILTTLEERARERGFDRAVLETSEHLEAARHLYEDAGYEQTGREPHPQAGFDLVSYRKEL